MTEEQRRIIDRAADLQRWLDTNGYGRPQPPKTDTNTSTQPKGKK